MSAEIFKEKEHEQLWDFAKVKIVEFNCFPESVSEILESQKSLYVEEGYEILDYCIKSSGRMCNVELLIKPSKKIS